MTPLDPTLLLAIVLALSVVTICTVVVTVYFVAAVRAWVGLAAQVGDLAGSVRCNVVPPAETVTATLSALGFYLRRAAPSDRGRS